MSRKPKDPCKKNACMIQACLDGKNNKSQQMLLKN